MTKLLTSRNTLLTIIICAAAGFATASAAQDVEMSFFITSTGPGNGELIANDVEELHSASVKINRNTALDENDIPVNAQGDGPNQHDILTGSDSNGHFSTAGGDTTCNNWTSSVEGSATTTARA